MQLLRKIKKLKAKSFYLATTKNASQRAAATRRQGNESKNDNE
jgi:hypothetical protein